MAIKPKDLLFKYFSNNCTKEELRFLEQWIEQSPENQVELEKLEKIWFSQDSFNFEPDIDNAWNAINRVISHNPLTITHRSISPTIRWISGIAASVALVAVVWFYFLDTTSDWQYVSTNNDQRIEYDLPDGSKVWLKENSKLGFNFSDKERELNLSGEGFFDVEINVNRPFTITLQNSQIQVLGTSFYASSAINGNDQVSVMSGTVSFTDLDDDDKRVVLEAGNEAILEFTSNNMIRQTISDPNIMAWQTGILVFNKTPLRTVCKELTDFYQVDISLENNSMENCLITSKFDNQSLEEVLGIIKKLLSAELIRTENGYLLKGQGC